MLKYISNPYRFGDKMFIRLVRKSYFSIGIILMLVAVSIFGNFVSAQANPNIATSTIFIDSRFKLWDTNEKMLDAQFNITIVYFNSSSNNSAYYKIDVDNNISEGYFKNSTKKQYFINQTMIHYLKIFINNKTVYETTNIIITNQISKSLIDYANNQWTINLSPFEWTQKERNIFSAAVIGALMCLLIAYRITTKYKKSKGIQTFK